jgi:hypothetical protein
LDKFGGEIMKIYSLFFLIFFLPAASSAAPNQTVMAILRAAKNIVKTPITEAERLFIDKKYREMRDETKQDPDNFCSLGILGEDKITDLINVSDKARDKECSCVAWGSCLADMCPCDKLCPKGFGIFRHPEGITPKNLSTESNGLAFRNTEGGSKHKGDMGYCWGHARLTSQFNRLAFFDGSKKAPYDLHSEDLQEQRNAIKYYKGLIDKISKNKSVDIPGFPDLQSLSSEPSLQSYIADKVAEGWADQAMSWQGLGVSLGAKSKSDSKYQEILEATKERLDMNMQPTLVFTFKGQPFFTHASLVSHYEKLDDGSIKLCMRDNNFPESNAAKCEDYITLNKEGGLHHSYYGELGSIKVAHNENKDAVIQAKALRKKCQDEKKCEGSN